MEVDVESDDSFYNLIRLVLFAAAGYGAWRLWKKFNSLDITQAGKRIPTKEDIEVFVEQFGKEFDSWEDFLKAAGVPWDKKNFGKASE